MLSAYCRRDSTCRVSVSYLGAARASMPDDELVSQAAQHLILYELNPHGTGWRVEQQVNEATEDGWAPKTSAPQPARQRAQSQEGPAAEGPAADGEEEGSAVMPSVSAVATAALRHSS